MTTSISRYDRALFLFVIAYRWQCESWISRVSHCKTFFTFLSSAGMGWWLSTLKFSQFWEKKLFWGSNRLVSHDHPQAIVFLGVSRQRSVVQNIADRSAIVAKKPSIIAIAIILWVDSWYSLIKKSEKKTLKTLSLSRIGGNHFHSSPSRGN